MRESVPCDRIAATCRPMMNTAAITAATICATSRVRFGPIRRNSAMVIATESAAAVAPIAITTP